MPEPERPRHRGGRRGCGCGCVATLAVSLAASLAAAAAVVVAWTATRRAAYEATRLAPFSLEPRPSLGKEALAAAMVGLPGVGRLLTTGTAGVRTEGLAARLEGFHDVAGLVGGTVTSAKGIASQHFAENFYFWAQVPGETRLVVTTRLSFYGVNASAVVPWFSFAQDGESWDLPPEFEAKTLPHKQGDARVAVAPGLGELLFEVIEPMREWRLSYTGVVSKSSAPATRTRVRAVFRLKFSPKDVYYYNVHPDLYAMARSMAVSPWTPTFFRNLRAQNQERYASKTHGGEGEIAFLPDAPANAEPTKTVTFPAIASSRDHNVGIRNWNFLHSYIWWPPVHISLEIEGVRYTSFVGTFVEYGNVFRNFVGGVLMSDDGATAAFSSATSMADIAPAWYNAPFGKPYVPHGEKLIPGEMNFTIAILNARYALDCHVLRGSKAGLWSHTFWLKNGEFEIHEAQTKFTFNVRKWGSSDVVTTGTAVGLFEFGKNVVGLDDAA